MFTFLYSKEYVRAKVIHKHQETESMVQPTIYGFSHALAHRKCFLTLKLLNQEMIELVNNEDFQKVIIGQNVTVEKLRSRLTNKINKVNILIQK